MHKITLFMFIHAYMPCILNYIDKVWDFIILDDHQSQLPSCRYCTELKSRRVISVHFQVWSMITNNRLISSNFNVAENSRSNCWAWPLNIILFLWDGNSDIDNISINLQWVNEIRLIIRDIAKMVLIGSQYNN